MLVPGSVELLPLLLGLLKLTLVDLLGPPVVLFDRPTDTVVAV